MGDLRSDGEFQAEAVVNDGEIKKDFKDSYVGPGGPDWVNLIFTNSNSSLQAIGLDRRFGQTALPSSGWQMGG